MAKFTTFESNDERDMRYAGYFVVLIYAICLLAGLTAGAYIIWGPFHSDNPTDTDKCPTPLVTPATTSNDESTGTESFDRTPSPFNINF